MAAEFGHALEPVGHLSPEAARWWAVLAPVAAKAGVSQDDALELVLLCRNLARCDRADEAMAEGVTGAAAQAALMFERQVLLFVDRIGLTRAAQRRMRQAVAEGKKAEAEREAREPAGGGWAGLLEVGPLQ